MYHLVLQLAPFNSLSSKIKTRHSYTYTYSIMIHTAQLSRPSEVTFVTIAYRLSYACLSVYRGQTDFLSFTVSLVADL